MAGPTAFGSLSAVLTDVVAWVVATDLASLGRHNLLHERLFDATESGSRPFHPLISHVDIAPLAPGDIAAQPWARAAARRRPGADLLASPSSR
jgi:hypothetical protein